MLFLLPNLAFGNENLNQKHGFKTILSCKLSDNTVAVLKSKIQADEDNPGYFESWPRYWIKIHGVTRRAFNEYDGKFDDPGTLEFARCVNNVVIFSVDCGPPYLRGKAIRVNPDTYAIEQLYFSRKRWPKWLYQDKNRMIIIAPAVHGEGDERESKKYFVYEYLSGKGPLERRETDILPVPRKKLVHIHSKKYSGS